MLQNILLRLYVSCDIIQITTVTIIVVYLMEWVFSKTPTLSGSFNEALYISLNVLSLDSPPPRGNLNPFFWGSMAQYILRDPGTASQDDALFSGERYFREKVYFKRIWKCTHWIGGCFVFRQPTPSPPQGNLNPFSWGSMVQYILRYRGTVSQDDELSGERYFREKSLL